MITVKLFCKRFISFTMRKAIFFCFIDNNYSEQEASFMSEKIEEVITSKFWVKNKKSVVNQEIKKVI